MDADTFLRGRTAGSSRVSVYSRSFVSIRGLSLFSPRLLQLDGQQKTG
jgi:hypothetical protein